MKTLHRSQTNKIVFGIFGGLGVYFNIDPVFLRLVWVFVTVLTGLFPGLVTYLVGYILIPRKTT